MWYLVCCFGCELGVLGLFVVVFFFQAEDGIRDAQESRGLGTGEGPNTFREVSYRETNGVGWLSFEFLNGAMSVDQCRRLLEAYRYAAARPTKVIVLAGGREFWSNGMHLGVIEACLLYTSDAAAAEDSV